MPWHPETNETGAEPHFYNGAAPGKEGVNP